MTGEMKIKTSIFDLDDLLKDLHDLFKDQCT